jgi:3-oxoacyl-[acyl-carrier-protein] synthase II
VTHPESRTQAAVVAWSLYLCDADLATVLPEVADAQPQRAGEPVYQPEQARELLGRKGLVNRDPATRLALCAVHRALGHPPGPRARDGTGPDPRTAVVASSNFSNVAAVAGIVEAVRTGGRRAVSPLAVPNASSNVLASAVASWFGFGGPSLLICSGATAGLDAIATGMLLLRAGRADRVVVVGAEPADELARALNGAGAPLRAGAACVVLAPIGTANAAALLGPVRAGPTAPPPADLGPAGAIDITARYGDLYGALGVAQVATLAALAGRISEPDSPTVTRRTRPIQLVCGDDTDGWRSLTAYGPL